MDAGAGDEVEGPLPRKKEKAADEVDGLEDWYRLDGTVEGLGEEVPQDLGPEVPFYRSGNLV